MSLLEIAAIIIAFWLISGFSAFIRGVMIDPHCKGKLTILWGTLLNGVMFRAAFLGPFGWYPPALDWLVDFFHW